MTEMEQLPPHDRQAEESVLGSILLDSESILKVCDSLRGDDFYLARHQQIYTAMLALIDRGEPVQFVGLCAELERRGQIDEVGGAAYLTSLIGVIPTAIHIEHYARDVKRLSVCRKGITLSAQLGSEFYGKPENPEAVIGDYGTKLLTLTEQANRRNPDPDDILLRYKAFDHNKGIKLSMRTLNYYTDGFVPGEFWVIGAFSSTGKTALALQLMRDALDAKNADGTPRNASAVYFSLEMSQEQLMFRLVSNISQVPMRCIRYSQEMTKERWNDVHDAEQTISDRSARLKIYDDVYTVPEISYLCRKHKLQGALDVVFVDYLQNLRGSGERKDVLGDGANQLLQLAKQLQCTVVALSQITTGQARENMGDNDTYSFKDSGAIRDASDKAIILSRDRKEQEHGATSGALLVKIKKNRTGMLGEVRLQFDFATGRIWEVTSDRY